MILAPPPNLPSHNSPAKFVLTQKPEYLDDNLVSIIPPLHLYAGLEHHSVVAVRGHHFPHTLLLTLELVLPFF